MKRRILSVLLTLALMSAPLSFGSYAEPPYYCYEYIFSSGEVLAPADSLEEAQRIAALYMLELKSYAYGIAVLSAQSPGQAVMRSKAAGVSSVFSVDTAGGEIPPLSLNRVFTTSSTYFPSDNKPEAGWHLEEMDAERAWAHSTGAGVVVAVIDTGVDVNHPALTGRLLPNAYNSREHKVGLQYVYDNASGHGTLVAGIIAGGDNIGIAPDAMLLVINASEPMQSMFYSDSILRGINYAVENGADIINMSLGRPFDGGYDSLEHKTIQNAVSKGILVVCAAGNELRSNADFPAAYPESVAVSATRQGFIFECEYSNFGQEIDIAAPGSHIFSTVASDEIDFAFMRGTSAATPNVSGTAALVKSLNPGFSAEELRDVLQISAKEAGRLGKDILYGHGIVNSYAAVLGIDALHSVTYDLMGVSPSVVVKAAPESRLIEPEYTYGDYFVEGWTLSPGGGSFFDFSAKISGDITLYAKWNGFPLFAGFEAISVDAVGFGYGDVSAIIKLGENREVEVFGIGTRVVDDLSNLTLRVEVKSAAGKEKAFFEALREYLVLS